MSFAVEFTTGARQDLLKIYRYIKADGRPETAKRLYEILSLACNSLSQNPERGHVPSELEGFSETLCRQIVIKNIRIIYQIIGKLVIIHGIIDGHRNIRETMRQRILIWKNKAKKTKESGLHISQFKVFSIRLIFILNFLSFLSFSEKH